MSRRERRLEARKFLDDAPVVVKHETTRIGNFFDKNYHKLQLIPLLILLFAIGYNIHFDVTHGSIVRKGVSLAGGVSVSVTTNNPVPILELQASLEKAFPAGDFSIRVLKSGQTQTGFVVDAANIGDNPDPVVALLKTQYPDATFSTETTGSSLGDSFFQQTLVAVLVAFVLMAVVVLISFRNFYPSMAVVLAGMSTVTSTLAVFNMLGLQLSTAGVAAFLMLIGYSIDTDILLSTRVLRGTDSFINNVWSAAKTGITMQITTAVTVTTVLIFSNNVVFTQIMTIILIGMFFDVLYTWFQNAAILKWYIERRDKKGAL